MEAIIAGTAAAMSGYLEPMYVRPAPVIVGIPDTGAKLAEVGSGSKAVGIDLAEQSGFCFHHDMIER